MSKRDTKHAARNIFSVLAVALLCAAVFAVCTADPGIQADGAPGSAAAAGSDDDTGTDDEKSYKVTITVTNGKSVPTSHDVKEGERCVFNLETGNKDFPDYVLPEISGVKVTPSTATVNKLTYSINEDHKKADVIIENVTSNCVIKVDCLKAVKVVQSSTVDGKTDDVEIDKSAFAGKVITGTFPAKDGYNIPSSITVMNGKNIWDIGTSGYSPATGKFSFTIKDTVDITKPVKVHGVYSNKVFAFSSSIIGGGVKEKDIAPQYNFKDLKITIVPDKHHDFPDACDITVTNGKSHKFVYDATAGVITIPKVEGNVSVTAKCNPGAFTVTYHGTDGKEIPGLEPQRFLYGIECKLPTDVVRADYIFTGWVDKDRKPITAIAADWEPNDENKGNVDVFATFKDDLSKYDVGDYQMPYLIAALLSLVALAAVPLVMKVRR